MTRKKKKRQSVVVSSWLLFQGFFFRIAIAQLSCQTSGLSHHSEHKHCPSRAWIFVSARCAPPQVGGGRSVLRESQIRRDLPPTSGGRAIQTNFFNNELRGDDMVGESQRREKGMTGWKKKRDPLLFFPLRLSFLFLNNQSSLLFPFFSLRCSRISGPVGPDIPISAGAWEVQKLLFLFPPPQRRVDDCWCNEPFADHTGRGEGTSPLHLPRLCSHTCMASVLERSI